jgi:hypothetical protein
MLSSNFWSISFRLRVNVYELHRSKTRLEVVLAIRWRHKQIYRHQAVAGYQLSASVTLTFLVCLLLFMTYTILEVDQKWFCC